MLHDLSTVARLGSRPSVKSGSGEVTPTTSLVIVGYPGSGKSTLAKVLGESAGIRVLEMGDLVRREAAEQSPPNEPMEYAAWVFGRRAPTYFVEILLRDLGHATQPVIVVGPRRPEELDLIRRSIAPVVCLALDVSKSVRRRRQRSRLEGPFHAELTGSWEHRDSVERGWGLDTVINSADHAVNGDEDLDRVAEQARLLWTGDPPNR